MTSLAVGEIIPAEGTLVVVTGHTAQRALRCPMHRRNWLAHLTWRSCSAFCAMTIIATQLLRRGVLGMVELNLISSAKGWRPLVSALLVTNIARRQIASRFLSPDAMTLIAGRVSAFSGRYRERDAPIYRLMTSSTSGVRMTRVIEFHVEAPQPGKRLELRTLWLRIHMTHGTDRALH